MTHEWKRQIRSELLGRRKELPDEYRKSQSILICDKLIKLDPIKQATTILLYHSFRGEVSTDELARWAWQQKKQVVYPKADPKTCTMDGFEVHDFDELVSGAYGIKEPVGDGERYVAGEKIDVAIIPAVGFDYHGYRIGYGAGYYDRFLGLYPHIIRIGIAYPQQIVEDVFAEFHDQKMDILITSEQTITLIR